MMLPFARLTLVGAVLLGVCLTTAATPALAAADSAASASVLTDDATPSDIGDETGQTADEVLEQLADDAAETWDLGLDAAADDADSAERGAGVFDIDRRLGHETSGMVVSSVDSDYVFTMDDRAGNSFIGVALTNGRYVGRVQVRGMRTHNAEAMAAGPCSADGRGRCLYIGDIGNNRGRDRPLHIWRVQEPDPDNLPRDAVPAEQIDFRYPDGVFDAEAILVDDHARLVVITKREAPGRSQALRRIYVGRPDGGQMTYVSTLNLPAPPNPKRSLRWGDLVTDASAADGQVLILTYDQAVLFTAPSSAADLLAFAHWPLQQWSVTQFRAAEAVSLVNRRSAGSGARFAVAGEGFHGQQGQIGLLGGS